MNRQIFVTFRPTVFILLNTLLWFFFQSLVTNYTFLDLTYRLNVNESILFSYYFFWTSYWYLFWTFLAGLIVTLSWWSQRTWRSLLSILFICCYFYEIIDIFCSNKQLCWLNVNFFTPNLFLTNSLNKIHPLLLYISVWLFITVSSIFYSSVIQSSYRFKGAQKGRLFQSLVKLCLPLISLALLLGSWWALQEGTWGGWWNWDPSEVLGLTLLVSLIYYYHFLYNVSVFLKYLVSYLVLYLLLLSLYFFIQVNFELVSHNFGIKFFYFFDNNTFLLESFALCPLLIVTSLTKYTRIWTQLIPLTAKVATSSQLPFMSIKWSYFVSLFFLVNLIYAQSFNFLWNFFFWKYLSINMWNLLFDINWLTWLSLLSFYIYYYQFGIKKLSQLLIWTPFQAYLTMLILYPIWRRGLHFTIHHTLTVFTVTNLISFKTILLYWAIGNYDLSLFQLNNPITLTELSGNLDLFLNEASMSTYTTFSEPILNWTLQSFRNSSSVSTFNLINAWDNFVNIVAAESHSSVFSFIIEDVLTMNLVFIVVFIVGSFRLNEVRLEYPTT